MTLASSTPLCSQFVVWMSGLENAPLSQGCEVVHPSPSDWSKLSQLSPLVSSAKQMLPVWFTKKRARGGRCRYLRVLIFHPVILIPACNSSSLAFCMMYSAYKLNKQDGKIQPCCTPFPIWNQSVIPCKVLTVTS